MTDKYLTLAEVRNLVGAMSIGWRVETHGGKVRVFSPLGSVKICRVLHRDGFEVVSRKALDATLN